MIAQFIPTFGIVANNYAMPHKDGSYKPQLMNMWHLVVSLA